MTDPRIAILAAPEKEANPPPKEFPACKEVDRLTGASICRDAGVCIYYNCAHHDRARLRSFVANAAPPAPAHPEPNADAPATANRDVALQYLFATVEHICRREGLSVRAGEVRAVAEATFGEKPDDR